ncbi:Protein of unknown function [Methylophilus rhizosphaerae]|uniref:DUF2946 domain-containing protein n=1 Tax=Methylophilus rhizosphaerae TaxID=492660 RepID=A0A1G9EW23_9PROT|nr:DUF2946 family protein [Methylophilus rhizosphaerae]SDK80185.1 Protein of unknown function [Methylophilus rhizosphaerae]
MALMAIMLAALVPTLSLAFPMQSGKGFVQEVCSSQGSKLLVQVITTQGKLLPTLIDYKPSQKPVSLSHHLNHCPFCHMALDEVALPSHSPAYVLFQQAQADSALSAYLAPVVPSVYPAAHPSRAPPLTSISI